MQLVYKLPVAAAEAVDREFVNVELGNFLPTTTTTTTIITTIITTITFTFTFIFITTDNVRSLNDAIASQIEDPS